MSESTGPILIESKENAAADQIVLGIDAEVRILSEITMT